MLALLGVLRASGLGLERGDIHAVIDEWTLTNPTVLQQVKNSHLVVVGTPEVNILGAFLHGFVKDFHFGQQVWPPDLASAADRLFVGGSLYLRCPYASEVNDCGGVFLVKNPWNPNYRILWVAGLTGMGTWHACTFVASGWEGYTQQADKSIGVVLGRDILANTLADSREVRPQDWLMWTNGEPVWQSSRIPMVNQASSGDRGKHKQRKLERKQVRIQQIHIPCILSQKPTESIAIARPTHVSRAGRLVG
jgi:hypothetical protein